jgi:hypothetical protein|tara:strand:- start:3315 stop:3503 length:189 start_codon:yes stop_codon:yes gene_type:complete
MGPWNSALVTVSLDMVARLMDNDDYPSAIRIAGAIVETVANEGMYLTEEEEGFLFEVIFIGE